MSQPKPEDAERLSPGEMQKWLQQETADMAKAFELRTKEASELVAAYTSGKISPDEAEERLWKYNKRWPEALPGTHTVKGASDTDILAEIDEARHPQFAERLMEKGRRRSNKSGANDTTL